MDDASESGSRVHIIDFSFPAAPGARPVGMLIRVHGPGLMHLSAGIPP